MAGRDHEPLTSGAHCGSLRRVDRMNAVQTLCLPSGLITGGSKKSNVRRGRRRVNIFAVKNGMRVFIACTFGVGTSNDASSPTEPGKCPLRMRAACFREIGGARAGVVCF